MGVASPYWMNAINGGVTGLSDLVSQSAFMEKR
jgi:hypothetical protein